MPETYGSLIAKQRGFGSFHNAGLASDSTTQMLARYSAEVLAHRPSAVSIMGGPNDLSDNVSGAVWIGGGTSAATTKSNLKTMIQSAQAQRARVTLMTYFPPVTGTGIYITHAGPYLAAIAEAAAETGCEFFDLYAQFIAMTYEERQTYYIDSWHQNAAGHAKAASLILASGNPLLFAPL